DFTRPTHLFQFYSSIHSYQNLPPFSTSVISPQNENSPKIAFVETIVPSEISTKYTASDHRTLALLSYFCSTPAMLTKQENTKWWQFDKPLIHHSPWCLDWTKGLTKGVFVFLWRCSLESTFVCVKRFDYWFSWKYSRCRRKF